MFKSINYSRIVCEKCNEETIIEPGHAFKGLNCKCNTEVSKQYKNITLWTDGENTIEVLGEFENGDFEVKYPDGTLSYRLPHQTLVDKYNEVKESIQPPSLEDMTVKELKKMAKEKGIIGADRMSKDKLIEGLTNGKD